MRGSTTISKRCPAGATAYRCGGALVGGLLLLGCWTAAIASDARVSGPFKTRSAPGAAERRAAFTTRAGKRPPLSDKTHSAPGAAERRAAFTTGAGKRPPLSDKTHSAPGAAERRAAFTTGEGKRPPLSNKTRSAPGAAERRAAFTTGAGKRPPLSNLRFTANDKSNRAAGAPDLMRAFVARAEHFSTGEGSKSESIGPQVQPPSRAGDGYDVARELFKEADSNEQISRSRDEPGTQYEEGAVGSDRSGRRLSSEGLLLPLTAIHFQRDELEPPLSPPVDNNVPSDTVLTPFEILDHAEELSVVLRRSKLMRSRLGIFRTAIADPGICEVVQFTPQEVSIIGRARGATHVTFWFEDRQQQPVTYLVRVVPDPEVQERREEEYEILEEMIAELFPDSKVHLVPVSNKLMVTGEAKDAEEAAQILAIIRGEGVYGSNSGYPYGTLFGGMAADPLPDPDSPSRLPASQVINMLRIPGMQQVALRVKIAELDRSAARSFGVDLDLTFDGGKAAIQTLLNVGAGSAASILGMFDNDDLNFGIHFLQQQGVIRILSEPTLVTLSGRPASFVAGGEFAVPTTVGVGGAAAVTTDFRSFGAIISFLPVVLDKDHIRLEISPEFSQVDNDLTVNGTPGLSTRAVTTTVEMREGQTLAIAGLLDDSTVGNMAGSLPLVWRFLGRRSMSHNETELIILVTPELVHPMDPEEVPPLPGFDVTEPDNTQFFLKGQIEGPPHLEYRSTVWPRLRRRYRSGASSMISGPFGHGQ